MENKKIFDEDVLLYDQWRPHYDNRLFNDILNYSNLKKNGQIVEIGIGTGIATKPFLDLGFSVMGIDVSEKMIDYVNEKFKSFDNFTSACCEFEKASLDSESIDLIFSATAFHWIDESIGYKIVLDLLKKTGTIALFWNYPFVARENDPVHVAIQNVYQKYEDLGIRKKSGKQMEDNFNKYQSVLSSMKRNGIVDIEMKTYKNKRKFLTDEYICLLNTYSDHRAMENNTRIQFEEEIKEAINKNGGYVIVYDTNVLFMGKK